MFPFQKGTSVHSILSLLADNLNIKYFKRELSYLFSISFNENIVVFFCPLIGENTVLHILSIVKYNTDFIIE